ncbi:MAG: hypothetical protein LBR82_04345 [Desulfovibrio sp.]|jgi:uncharacterized Zn finger protein|nr:hypothetical protein [Desulfovibrio sp.]
MAWWYRREHESVGEKRLKAERTVEKLRKKRSDLRPVHIQGRLLSRTFWGKEWCRQMDMTADYSNRLPRGRSYVRNGAVCHLEIREGEIEALVSGTKLYSVTVRVAPLPCRHWELIQAACKEKISTLVDLLQGKLSKEVLAVVCHPETGIFPKPSEISFYCSCPDWAGLCKHTAAVLYGVGSRLDEEPELLFLLRHVDPRELFSLDMAAPMGGGEAAALQGVDLGGLFGIDLADDGAAAREPDRRPVPAEDTAPAAQQAAEQPDKQAAGRPDKQAAQQSDRQAAQEAGTKTAPQADSRGAQQVGGPAAKEAGRQTSKQTDRRAAKQAAQQADRKAVPQAVKQTPQQTGRRAAKEAGRQTAQQTGRRAAKETAARAFTPQAAQTPADPVVQKRAVRRKRAGADTPPALPVLDFTKVTGAEITALREAAGLSLPSFAYRLDIAAATLERWEKTPALITMQQASRKKLQTLYKKLQQKFAVRKS